jgi:nitroreductase
LVAIVLDQNPVIGAIKSRRAIRSYEDKPVPEPAIKIILEAATYAPSAINIQPWKFTLVTNKAEMKRFSDVAKQTLSQTLPDVGDEGLERFKNALKNPQFNMFYGAPLLVFISGAPSQFAINDCSMAAQNMMLAAYTFGVGSCWIGGATQYANTQQGKTELGVPEDHKVYAAIVFGYPKGDFPQAPQKRPPQILKRID